MKILIFTFLTFFSQFNLIVGQENTNCTSRFKIQKHLKFKHFNDSLVIREQKNLKNELIIDTVYSCNFDEIGNIKEERYNNYNSSVNNVTKYYYNGTKLEFKVSYMQPWIVSDFDYNEVNVTTYTYTDFDSVDFTKFFILERYAYFKMDSSALEIRSYTNIEYIRPRKMIYLDSINCYKIFSVNYKYNRQKKLIERKCVLPVDFDPTNPIANIAQFHESITYDSLSRISRQVMNYYYFLGMFREEERYKQWELKYKYYPSDSIVIKNNTPINYERKFSIKKIYYNSLEMLEESIEYYPKEGDNSLLTKKTNYYYDKNNNLIRKSIVDEHEGGIYYKTFYHIRNR